MLGIKFLEPGNAHYCADLGVEDYMRRGGEPPGRWLGSGAAALGRTGTVVREEFLNAFEGRTLDGAGCLVDLDASKGTFADRKTGKQREKKRQPGWDLTFSAPKSVSLAWAIGPQEIRQAIQQAHFEAVKTALGYVEETCAWSRRGKGGQRRERAGLIIATYEHGTSRERDPQLHTHALVLNACVRADGTTGALMSKPFYEHKMAAGAVYRAELAANLQRSLGLAVRREKSWFEIEGISPKACQDFSKRSAAIQAEKSRQGISTAYGAEKIALDTRPHKGRTSRSELFAEWRAAAGPLGLTP